MTTHVATFIGETSVLDPDSGEEIVLEVFKDPVSQGMFAIDASFTDQVTDAIVSPFNEEYHLRLDVPETPQS